jgi:SET domain-containing protein
VQRAISRRTRRLLQKKKIPTQNDWLVALYENQMHAMPEEVLEIRWINRDIGYGVFAKKDLPEYTFIGEYTGLVRRRKLFGDHKNNYCFRYQIGPYLSRFVIDAKFKGNSTRMINHCDDPNAKPHSLITSDGIAHIIICTNRFIAKGEELTYDYGPEFWRRRRKTVYSQKFKVKDVDECCAKTY